jgi:hypothetical protein
VNAADGSLNRTRRSMIGTMAPRRFSTPSNLRRGLRNAADSRPATGLLHTQNVDAEGFVTEPEGQYLSGA